MIGVRIKWFIDQIAKAYKEYKITQAKRKRILNISHPGKYLISEDHAYFSSSSCCPLCSLYNGRIFSISGKDTRFPSLVLLPDEIHDGKCDVCKGGYSLNTWFESVKSSEEVLTAIQQSNALLIDKRTPEQKAAFEEKQAKLARRPARLQANNNKKIESKTKEVVTWTIY